MTSKDILKEFIWGLIGLIITGGLTVLLFSTSSGDTIANFLPINTLFSDFSNKLRLLFFLILFLPVLFIIIGGREALRKFRNRSQNMYLIFISLVSLFNSIVILFFLEPIATILYGSWTIYPPLSAFQEEFTPPKNFETHKGFALVFILLQIVIFFITVWKVFKKTPVTIP